jgi:hypothetical protein
MIDGLPVSGSEFSRRANSESLNVVFSGAVSGIVPLVPFGVGIFGYPRPAGWHHDEEGPELDWEESFFSSSGKNRPDRHPANPQNPTQPPIDASGVETNIATRLTDDCRRYIANLINEAARQNKNNPAVSTDLLKIFNDVRKQGGFHRLQVGTRKKPSYSTIRGTIPEKNATIYLAPLKLYPDMTATEIAQGALSLDSIGAFHELVHLAGSKIYDDIQLSMAARALGGPPLPPDKDNRNLAFSQYLEDELKRNCPY